MTANELTKFSGIDSSELRACFGQLTVPVSPVAIANGLGIEVLYRYDVSPDLSGEISYDKTTGKATIWVNGNHAVVRQRFTIGHELGHLINDILPTGGSVSSFQDSKVTLQRTLSNDAIEFNANEFSADLLMPGQLISDAVDKLVASGEAPDIKNRTAWVSKLAVIFHVSIPAMNRRLEDLGVWD